MKPPNIKTINAPIRTVYLKLFKSRSGSIKIKKEKNAAKSNVGGSIIHAKILSSVGIPIYSFIVAKIAISIIVTGRVRKIL